MTGRSYRLGRRDAGGRGQLSDRSDLSDRSIRKSLAPRLALAILALLAATGCRQDMHDQPKIEPLEANAFFANRMGARQIPAGTVARGFLREDTAWWEGKDTAGDFVENLPAQVELSRELLLHGRKRFDIFCSVCHDKTGGGRGMIVRRGFKQPPPLYEDRLLAMPAGYFFDVITHGFGLMSSYARPLTVADRWAVVAYIRALQLARTTREAELPAPLQTELRSALAAAGGSTAAEEGHP